MFVWSLAKLALLCDNASWAKDQTNITNICFILGEARHPSVNLSSYIMWKDGIQLCPAKSENIYMYSEGGRRLFSPMCLSVCLWTGYLKKVVDVFGRNLVERLCVWQGRIDSMLVKIQIRIWLLEFFEWFFTIERSGQKQYIAWYLKKLWTDPDEMLWTGSVCDKDEMVRFWWRSGPGSVY